MTNPFLLPPGGGRPTPEPEPAPEPVVHPSPAGDPSRYIAIPPSVESATHRLARPATEPERESRREPSPAEPLVAEETRVAVPVATTWSLVLPGGRRLPVSGGVLLGRDPASVASTPGARLVALEDPGKTVSKTHALVEPAEGGVRVRDLYSTNGVAILADGVRTVLPEAGEAIAPDGSMIELGSFALVVEAGR